MQGTQGKDVPSLPLDCLDNISSNDLKRFQSHLRQGVPGYKPILWKHLERADRTDTVNTMLEHYPADSALTVTLHILREMNLNNEALTLARKMGRELSMGGPRPRVTPPPPAGPIQGGTTDREPHRAGPSGGDTTDSELRRAGPSGGDTTDREGSVADELLQITKKDLQTKFKNKYEGISEGIARWGNRIQLTHIFTDIYITEGESEEVNTEHEVRQIEALSKTSATQETEIGYNDIFNALPGQELRVRAVLMKGFAGIGKTVSVQKFILDWAEGKANEDISLIFPLPFRELNLMKERFSLLGLIQHYHPEMKGRESIDLNNRTVLFIFDGLDECRLPLDFQSNGSCYDVTESTSVDVLLTNLIKGNLLPSALLWITTRPAAANQIPPECIHRMTEVRGFKDQQKEEYFLKRFSDEKLANRIISHVKSSRSLYIMCHIPVFCWISATVLERMLGKPEQKEIPKTLTEMYTHFLLTQTHIRDQKFQKNSKEISDLDMKIIHKLGKLAFQNLEKNNLIFDWDDLRKCDINDADIHEALVCFGVCTEIPKEHSGLCQKRMYCFVHLSVQEYFAALYAFQLCAAQNVNPLHQEEDQAEHEPSSEEEEDFSQSYEQVEETEEWTGEVASAPLAELHRSAVDQALQSHTGHLDLFLRFLLGISLDSNQDLLKGLLTQTGSSSQSIKETVRYIKDKIRKNPSPERTINLFHCLSELQDRSLVEDIQRYLESNSLSEQKLTPDQCSALAYVLLMSEEKLELLDLKMYNTTPAGRHRLLPVVKYCEKAHLYRCNLTAESCGPVLSALHSPNSHLRDLDLSFNDLEDSGVKLFCMELQKPQHKLRSLRLVCCKLTGLTCDLLASALQSADARLKELDLSCNSLGDAGVKQLCAGALNQLSELETLGLRECDLTEGCCADLASVLRSPSSDLRELELRDNDLQDCGVRALSAGLEDPRCKLQRLGLSGCRVTEEGCASLAAALRLNPFHLRELDLSYNHPGDSGERALSAGLEGRSFKLQVENCGEDRNRPGLWKYACHLTLDPNTAARELRLLEGDRKVTRSKQEQPYPDHPERFDWPQVLCREGLSGGRSYWEVEWSGTEVQVGVAYREISRKGQGEECVLGWNGASWSLSIGEKCSAWHSNIRTVIRPPARRIRRVGVYLDRPAGALSFYSVSSGTATLLHTFHAAFTGPLHPGVWVQESSGSVTLCSMG
ncbi:NACHT, LRR and PYD domains-containing protein 3-like [Megalops cyprinoides]|uniref:NACHT, LRR and PYD domains-containing protein 3-like n=1 Tax=Megalops cyprinoides TaxID=118141 RepID=UPI001863E54D|nr:NACHT, LRR and PYD domains-containing protein 3-like [Megalops cyprinoides]